jgi:hypothetical protein
VKDFTAEEERLLHNARIQDAYRARNRERIDQANTVRAIVVRQKRHDDDMEILGRTISAALGMDDTRDLIDELEMNIKRKKITKTKTVAAAPKISVPKAAAAAAALAWVKMANGRWRARIAGGDDYWIGKRNGVFTVYCEPHPTALMRDLGTSKTFRAAKALAERDYRGTKLAEPAKLPRALKWKLTDPGTYMADLGDGFGYYQVDGPDIISGFWSASYYDDLNEGDDATTTDLVSRKTLKSVKKVCEEHWVVERQRLVQA